MEKLINYNKPLQSSLIVFSIILTAIYYIKPSLFFNDDGSMKLMTSINLFGIPCNVTFQTFSILLAIMVYYHFKK